MHRCRLRLSLDLCACFLKDEAIRSVGLLADKQSGSVKWSSFAFGWDGQPRCLDWETCQKLDDLEDLVDLRVYASEDYQERKWGVSLVYIDTGYETKRVLQFIAAMNSKGGFARWEGIRGRSKENTRQAAISAHWAKEYSVTDDHGNVIPGCSVRVHDIDASHWEGELYIRRIARFDPKAPPQQAQPRINFAIDADEGFLKEHCNMKQEYTKPKAGGIRELCWVKINSGPNDFGDLTKYALVMETAVREEEGVDP